MCFALIESETGKRCKSLRSDCGSEFVNQRVQTLLNIEHALLVTSSPRTPQQNGKAERSNRTLKECARTMLIASELPTNLWSEAMTTAAYLLNCTSKVNETNKTPFELWFNRKPCVGHLVEFGKEVQILIDPRKTSEWSSKTRSANIIGFTKRQNTYKVYVPSDESVHFTSDVIFRVSKKDELTTDGGEDDTFQIYDNEEGQRILNQNEQQYINQQWAKEVENFLKDNPEVNVDQTSTSEPTSDITDTQTTHEDTEDDPMNQTYVISRSDGDLTGSSGRAQTTTVRHRLTNQNTTTIATRSPLATLALD